MQDTDGSKLGFLEKVANQLRREKRENEERLETIDHLLSNSLVEVPISKTIYTVRIPKAFQLSHNSMLRRKQRRQRENDEKIMKLQKELLAHSHSQISPLETIDEIPANGEYDDMLNDHDYIETY
jgi:uncharacterized protein YaaR (DUF327 family)